MYLNRKKHAILKKYRISKNSCCLQQNHPCTKTGGAWLEMPITVPIPSSLERFPNAASFLHQNHLLHIHKRRLTSNIHVLHILNYLYSIFSSTVNIRLPFMISKIIYTNHMYIYIYIRIRLHPKRLTWNLKMDHWKRRLAKTPQFQILLVKFSGLQ